MSSSNPTTLNYGPPGADTPDRTVLGHPTGLFTIFFAEMWERFSFYGMKALLVLYMLKGFLAYGDDRAYAVYGAYTALVYMTPFIGGILADRLLGARRAVVMGGVLMAIGQFLLIVPSHGAFFLALALLVCGNGFFKPNISTIVGTLYPKDSVKKDAGFTIFYIGINLGAAVAPLICASIGERFGWRYGFGLAGIGMLIGIAVFVAPARVTQAMILAGALGSGLLMLWTGDSTLQFLSRLFLTFALGSAALIAFVALNRGGLSKQAGLPSDPHASRRKIGGVIRADLAVYLGTVLVIPVIFLILQSDKIALAVLSVIGAAALSYILYDALMRCGKIERERVFVILFLMFFSLLFWAFFEQAGSSVNNFTDRNIDRVTEARRVTQADVGSTVTFRVMGATDASTASLPLLTQEQLGYRLNDKPFTMTDLTEVRNKAAMPGAVPSDKVLAWPVSAEHAGTPSLPAMAIGGKEIPASEFQAVNPVYILVFGLVFTALWGYLGKLGLDPSTPVKFAMGLVQLGLGFAAFWYGARVADSRGMVGVAWLLLGYLLHTTGELCLSPVGLSMITKLSPARIVSTMMGAWFLATAFSQMLASMLAKLTSVGGDEGDKHAIPAPLETVHLYGSLFGKIAIASMISAVICFSLAPLLKKWMHEGVEVEAATPAGGFPVNAES